MVGRPRKTAAVLELEGRSHKTKAELEQRRQEEIVVATDELHPPDFLPKRLKDRFKWYVGQLEELNLIGNVDAELLARYVTSQDQYENVAKKIMRLDPVKNMEDYSKLVTAQNKLFTQCRQAGNDLGLSITSRGKLVVPKKEEVKEQTDEEKLFGGAL